MKILSIVLFIENMFKTKSEEGFEFENLIHDFLLHTRHILLRENDIVKKFGKSFYGIDHMILSHDKNLCVVIQDKWIEKPVNIKDLSYFLNTIDLLKKLDSTIFVVGIFISKYGLSNPAIERSINHNMSSHFYDVANTSILEIKKKLFKVLHSYEIYFYENDGCCVMLNNESILFN